MSCGNIIIQVYKEALIPGTPVLIAKCSGGEMDVLEIFVQAVGACTIQFFEGLPPTNSLGNPLSLELDLAAEQAWSKPGRVVSDDIYMLITNAATNPILVKAEVRSLPVVAGYNKGLQSGSGFRQ